MADLVEQCPPEWHKPVRPYLQRAVDFDAKQPLVAYFLRTHAASVASALPRSTPTTKFLLTLLDKLEAFKAANATELANADGRTVLTRAGLMLFTRADDMERAGQADEMVLKLFFTSAQVLEATKQFMPDGKLDPVAEEKVKYAKYVASLIKKSMDTKTPYVSPSQPAGGDDGGGSAAASAPPPPQAQAYALPQQPPATSWQPAPPQQPVPPPAAPAQQPQQTWQQPPPQQQQYPQYAPPQPQPVAPPVASPLQPAPQQQPYAPQQQQQQYPQYPSPAPPAPLQQQQQMYVPPPAPSNAAQQMDMILEAQKIAKQAVAALQFYDTITARRLLVDAVAILDGQHPVSRK